MENISLKSLVSQKTINEAEIDEGIFDTGWDAIKRAGAALVNQYNISKANGDEADALRAKKKYDDWAKKVEDKKAAAKQSNGSVDSKKSDIVTTSPDKTKDIPKDRPDDEKLANMYLSKTPPSPMTQSPDAASASEDAPDATPSVEKKSPIEKKYAIRLGNSIVKKLLKSTPKAVTPNTIGSVIKDPVKLNKQLDASVNIGRRLKSIIAKNYSGDVNAYIQKNDISSSQDALALLDIIRVLAGVKHKDRVQFIGSIFNGSEDVRRAITTSPAVPTQVPATSIIKKKTKAANTSPIVNTKPTSTTPPPGTNARNPQSRAGRGGTTANRNTKSRTENCEPSTVNGKLLEESINTTSNDSQKLFTRSTSIPNMFRLS